MARPPSIFSLSKGGQAQGPPPKYAPGVQESQRGNKLKYRGTV